MHRIAQMIVIIYAHPYPRHSRANSALLDALEDIPQISVRSLYDLYPDFYIDVAAEQAALAAASLVVWQHPMQWYSSPPLFRLWMDKVLQHGWAYGDGDSALKGKDLLWTVTTGGAADDFMRCTVTDLNILAQPLRSAAELCGMRWLDPYAVHGVNTLSMAELFNAGAQYRDRIAHYGAADAPKEPDHG
jgi:glutathione-regulated potassium-efflux system ancillary protein KefF